MLINWKQDIDSETQRLMHTFAQISRGFYSTNGFLVVPEGFAGDLRAAVILPDFQTSIDTGYLSRIKSGDISKLCEKGSRDFDYMQSLLKNNYKPLEYSEHAQKLEQVFDRVLKILLLISPKNFDRLKSITVFCSAFGTKSSFSLIDANGHIDVQLRLDPDAIAQLVFALIASATRQRVVDTYKSNWAAGQALADWFMCETQIADILAEIDQMHLPISQKLTEGYAMHEIELSEEFCRQLGIALPVCKFEIAANGKILADERLLSGLSPKQEEVMRALIDCSPKPLSIDGIADLIFSSDEKFSLYAIAKFVQRLRERLGLLGLNPGHIHTIKGRGYLIK